MSAETPPARQTGLEVLYGRVASTFRRRLAAGALALIVLLGALGTLVAWQQYQDGKTNATNEMRTRVVLAATVFDAYFEGRLTALRAIADAPSVVALDTRRMGAYFTRVQGDRSTPMFTGGLGWVDRRGESRVSDTRSNASPVNVSDRAYFRNVVSKGRPFISAGLRKRRDGNPAIVMAVPTRDAEGRITGVLAGALQLQKSRTTERSIALGYEGLIVVDRMGQQLTQTTFARPENLALLKRLRNGDGVLSDVAGLDGSSGRVVAFANSQAAGWTIALDRPTTSVFSSAWHQFVVEVISIVVATLALLAIVAWAIVRSRRELERERERMRRWDELAQSLGEAAATDEVVTALGASLALEFPGAHVIVGLQEEEDRRLRLWAAGENGALDTHNEGPRWWHGSLSIWGLRCDSRTADTSRMLEPVRDALPLGVAELYAVPIHTQSGRTIGSVTLLLPEEQALAEADEALVAAQADHAGRALSRARRYEHEHEVAVALQRNLLPASLPTVEGVELAGRYSAGGAGLEVGGDWYDALRRPDGIVHLTVGDVAGRGIGAAVLMGQLRNAFRALAYEHTSPAEIARRMLRHVPDAGMATAIFLTLDPYTGELAYSSAGHPPTILLDEPTGEVTLLDQASSPPLGWAETSDRRRAPAACSADDAARLHRRSRRAARFAIDDGIDRVSALLRGRTGTRPARSRTRCSSRRCPVAAADDVALLLVQLGDVPATMRVEIPADPHALGAAARPPERVAHPPRRW